MGVFDMFFKKKEENNSEEKLSQRDFERYLTQNVAIVMNNMHITPQPVLRFFKEGADGIITGVILSHLNDPEVSKIKQMDSNIYLSLLGCHALGAGGYITLCQQKFGKPVSEFTQSDSVQIVNDFHETDPYELFLNSMGFSPDSGNKKCLDHIVMSAISSARETLGDDIFEKEYLSVFMRVLFNAGITVVMR